MYVGNQAATSGVSAKIFFANSSGPNALKGEARLLLEQSAASTWDLNAEYPGGKRTLRSGLTLNRWYTLGWKNDIAANTYSVTLDGETLAGAVSYPAPASTSEYSAFSVFNTVDKLRWESAGGDVFYIDNAALRSGAAGEVTLVGAAPIEVRWDEAAQAVTAGNVPLKIAVNYSSSGAAVVKVEYFINGYKVSQTNNPAAYGDDLSWSDAPNGDYVVQVRITDSLGRTTLTGEKTMRVVRGRADAERWLGAGSDAAHIIAVKGDGTAWAWGRNSDGQLGVGDAQDRGLPVQIRKGDGSALSGVAQVAVGESHSAAVLGDGTLWTWGSNASGQLGDGTLTSRSIPGRVLTSGGGEIDGVKAVALGSSHSVLLKTEGTVWTWGTNSYGQLGNGTSVSSNRPLQVSGLSGITAVAAGAMSTMALKWDGTVWSWGNNASGQLGDGTTTARSRPVAVSGLSTVAAISAGTYHAVALKSDGTVWAWGNNGMLQLGDGTQVNRSSPVQVLNLDQIVAVGAAGSSAIALHADQTIWEWGKICGSGTIRSSPLQVSGFTAGAAVVTGGGLSLGLRCHAMALKADGTLWGWGANDYGQLGVGAVGGGYYTPTRVAQRQDFRLVLPSLRLTSPASQTLSISLPARLVVGAEAAGAQSGVAKVEFYRAPGVRIGQASGEPLGMIWSGVAAGEYLLYAKLTDRRGVESLTPLTAVRVTSGTSNQPPVAFGQTVQVLQPLSKAITLGALDAEGSALSFRITANPQHGSVRVSGNIATYTPSAGFTGSDGFAFVANDGRADSAAASVSILVLSAGAGPRAPGTLRVQSQQ